MTKSPQEILDDLLDRLNGIRYTDWRRLQQSLSIDEFGTALVAHVCTCSPDNIAAIAEYVGDLSSQLRAAKHNQDPLWETVKFARERIAELEAQNARLRGLLSKAVNGPWHPHDLETARAELQEEGK